MQVKIHKVSDTESVPVLESLEDRFHWAHQPGVGLLHAGKHRHGALSTVTGRRRNLILWCRSTSYRDTHNPEICPEWCQRSRAR